jgi:FtsP/CotA-like multicopper oxidase with cupredoxin domain
MPAGLSRRTLLAGLAAMPALALVGCEYDRTTAGPISTTDTLDFANRLRVPALADSTVDADGVRVFRLSTVSGSAEFLPGLSTPTWSYTDGRYDAGYLGPTLHAAQGDRVRVIVEIDYRRSPPCIGTVCIFRRAMTVARISPLLPANSGSRSG